MNQFLFYIIYIQEESVAMWKTVKISLPNVDDKIPSSRSVSKMDNLWLFVSKQYILHISTYCNFAST